jgi:hypothetical protein
MFKSTVLVNEHADPEYTMQSFMKQCAQSGVSHPDSLYKLVSAQVRELSERGSQLVAVGSSFTISRTLDGDDYTIIIEASFGSKITVIQRLRSLFGI